MGSALVLNLAPLVDIWEDASPAARDGDGWVTRHKLITIKERTCRWCCCRVTGRCQFSLTHILNADAAAAAAVRWRCAARWWKTSSIWRWPPVYRRISPFCFYCLRCRWWWWRNSQLIQYSAIVVKRKAPNSIEQLIEGDTRSTERARELWFQRTGERESLVGKTCCPLTCTAAAQLFKRALTLTLK